MVGGSGLGLRLRIRGVGWGWFGVGGTGCRGCGYPAQPNNVVSSDSYHIPVRGKG